MNGIGHRLKTERKRLGLTQEAFGKIGGVEPNAQGKYESGQRYPQTGYLAAVAAIGVDVVLVITDAPSKIFTNRLTQPELTVLQSLRSLNVEDREAIRRITTSLAG